MPKSILGVSPAQIEDSLALRSFVNGALFGEMYGTDRPEVLALHGWGRRGKDFSAALDGIDALALDLPGFGASPAPDAVIGADGYADIVREIFDLFDRPPVLVGHSFGGRVAVCLAAKYPYRIRGLVLTGVPLLRISPTKKPPFTYLVARKMNQIGVLSNDRMESLKRSRGSADYRAVTGVMRDVLVKVVNESYEPEMAALKCRVELLWGQNDTEVPVDVAEKSVEMIEDAALTVIPGVGHMIPIEAPDLLRSSVESLL